MPSGHKINVKKNASLYQCINYLYIPPETAVGVCWEKSEDFGIARFCHVHKRRPVSAPNDSVLFLRLRVRPPPNVIPVAIRTEVFQRHEREKIDVAAFVLTGFSVAAWCVRESLSYSRAPSFLNALLVLLQFQLHDNCHSGVYV